MFTFFIQFLTFLYNLTYKAILLVDLFLNSFNSIFEILVLIIVLYFGCRIFFYTTKLPILLSLFYILFDLIFQVRTRLFYFLQFLRQALCLIEIRLFVIRLQSILLRTLGRKLAYHFVIRYS